MVLSIHMYFLCQCVFLLLFFTQLSMPGDLLQATAAMFVSPDRPNRDVNYEKFLSFIGLALKQLVQCL